MSYLMLGGAGSEEDGSTDDKTLVEDRDQIVVCRIEQPDSRKGKNRRNYIQEFEAADRGQETVLQETEAWDE